MFGTFVAIIPVKYTSKWTEVAIEGRTGGQARADGEISTVE